MGSLGRFDTCGHIGSRGSHVAAQVTDLLRKGCRETDRQHQQAHQEAILRQAALRAAAAMAAASKNPPKSSALVEAPSQLQQLAPPAPKRVSGDKASQKSVSRASSRAPTETPTTARAAAAQTIFGGAEPERVLSESDGKDKKKKVRARVSTFESWRSCYPALLSLRLFPSFQLPFSFFCVFWGVPCGREKVGVRFPRLTSGFPSKFFSRLP